MLNALVNASLELMISDKQATPEKNAITKNKVTICCTMILQFLSFTSDHIPPTGHPIILSSSFGSVII